MSEPKAGGMMRMYSMASKSLCKLLRTAVWSTQNDLRESKNNATTAPTQTLANRRWVPTSHFLALGLMVRANSDDPRFD